MLPLLSVLFASALLLLSAFACAATCSFAALLLLLYVLPAIAADVALATDTPTSLRLTLRF